MVFFFLILFYYSEYYTRAPPNYRGPTITPLSSNGIAPIEKKCVKKKKKKKGPTSHRGKYIYICVRVDK